MSERGFWLLVYFIIFFFFFPRHADTYEMGRYS